MYKIPIAITIILIIAAGSATAYIIKCSSLVISDADLVSNLVALFACLGALISATFVVYSYIQTNKAFLLS